MDCIWKLYTDSAYLLYKYVLTFDKFDNFGRTFKINAELPLIWSLYYDALVDGETLKKHLKKPAIIQCEDRVWYLHSRDDKVYINQTEITDLSISQIETVESLTDVFNTKPEVKNAMAKYEAAATAADAAISSLLVTTKKNAAEFTAANADVSASAASTHKETPNNKLEVKNAMAKYEAAAALADAAISSGLVTAKKNVAEFAEFKAANADVFAFAASTHNLETFDMCDSVHQ